MAQRVRMMAGDLVDFGKQTERVDVVRVESQRLLQHSIGRGRVASMMCVERSRTQELRLLAVHFDLEFSLALLEELLTPLLAGWLRHLQSASTRLPQSFFNGVRVSGDHSE